MSEHKLVPFEPTPEMIEAAEDAHMPFGDMDLALRMAVLAAPAVQGEPDVTALVEALELALEYWGHRQQRYKNRRPEWVKAAEKAIAAYRKGGDA